jgi:ABC-type glycerol-3-phosphate transport system substrate-binding protein
VRKAVAVAAAVLVLAVCNGPPAMAEPAALPEVPAGGRVVFTDSPDLVDPHPAAIESWSHAATDDAVAVNFASGTPACSAVHATAQETEDTVTVDLRSGTLPQAVGRMCIMLAVFGTLDVPLQAPLGDRTVLSAS